MQPRRPQAVRLRPATLRSFLPLHHLTILLLLALTATAGAARAAESAADRWAAELSTASPLGPGAQPLSAYPGSLRLPERDDPLIHSLTVQTATTGLHPAGSAGAPFYQIVLGQTPDQGQPVQALIFGARGSALFPNLGVGPERPAGCPVTATYCTDSLYASEVLTTELFYNLTSPSGDRAHVVHTWLPNRESWTAILYSPTEDTLHGLTLHGEAARQLGSSGLGPANRVIAERLVQHAAGFPTVTLRPASRDS